MDTEEVETDKNKFTNIPDNDNNNNKKTEKEENKENDKEKEDNSKIDLTSLIEIKKKEEEEEKQKEKEEKQKTEKKENQKEKDKEIKEEIAENNNIEEDEENNLSKTSLESNYILDISTIDKLKSYLLKNIEIFDDDYNFSLNHITNKKYVPFPDPNTIFEFCANIMILTKMEKEVIIICLIYLERFIFNTGLLLTSRNWRRLIFITMVIASKIWDDDSFENNHFAQVFQHLKLQEINEMERIFCEMIGYKIYVKVSEYFKYFFIIKSIALKYNYNGSNLIPISVGKMIKIQEYAFEMQKKMKKKSLNEHIKLNVFLQIVLCSILFINLYFSNVL